jgi:hypothetical protein
VNPANQPPSLGACQRFFNLSASWLPNPGGAMLIWARAD